MAKDNDWLDWLGKGLKIILALWEFIDKVREILEDKEAEKAKIEKLERKGEYSKVKVNLISNGRVTGTSKYKVEDPDRELREGMIIE